MTDQEINTAIAEACGWTWIEEDYTYYGFTCEIPMKRKRWTPPNGGKTLDIPDYCNDLNAMQEAEKTLSESKRVLYGVRLAWECGHTDKKSVGLWHISTATAYHRAVAFLRTLGKWEEAK